jgi:hypothetical protein
MTDDPQDFTATEVPPAEKRLLAGAERRVGWFILGLIPVGAAVAFWQWGGETAGAFALGGGLAYANYRWIVSVVDALVRAQKDRPRARDYAKLFIPVVLLGVLLYGIFTVSWLSAVGVMSGVLLLVPAIFLETVYQILLGLRR